MKKYVALATICCLLLSANVTFAGGPKFIIDTRGYTIQFIKQIITGIKSVYDLPPPLIAAPRPLPKKYQTLWGNPNSYNADNAREVVDMKITMECMRKEMHKELKKIRWKQEQGLRKLLSYPQIPYAPSYNYAHIPRDYSYITEYKIPRDANYPKNVVPATSANITEISKRLRAYFHGYLARIYPDLPKIPIQYPDILYYISIPPARLQNPYKLRYAVPPYYQDRNFRLKTWEKGSSFHF